MGYNFDFASALTPQAIGLLVSGAQTTISLSLAAILLGTLVGLLLGFLATVGAPTFAPLRRTMATAPASATPLDLVLQALRIVTLAVIDIVRAIPLLLMVLLCYYAFPILFPSFDRTNVFVPCLVAFALNLGAFTGELVRAGVMALPPGSALAARSLGLSPSQTWTHIVLPQIVRDILPAQVVLFITIVKMSTLASAVSLYEILHSGNAVIQQTYRPLEIYVAIGLFFVIVIVPFAMLARRLETVSVFRRRAL